MAIMDKDHRTQLLKQAQKDRERLARMNPVQRFAARVSGVWRKLTAMRFSKPTWQYLLSGTKYDYQQAVGDGSGSSAVMAVTNYIVRTFTEPQLAIRELNAELLDRHDFLDLWNTPNPYYTGRTLTKGMLIDYVTQGDGYAIKVRNGLRRVVQIYYAPYSTMTPEGDDKTLITHYTYRPEGQPIRLEVDDVIRWQNGIDPHDVRKGLAPLRAQAREIFSDDMAANWVGSLLRNQGVPGIIIAPDEDDVTGEDDDVETVKSWFRSRFGGDHRGEPLVLDTRIKVMEFGFDPQRMDLSQLRAMSEARLSAAMGIPAAVVGFLVGVTQTAVGATLSELREMAFESCIVPMQHDVCESLEAQLFREFDTNERRKVVYDNSEVRVLQEDHNKQVERIDRRVQGGWITVANAKRAVGEEPDPGDNVYLRPLNRIEVPVGVARSLPVDDENKLLYGDGFGLKYPNRWIDIQRRPGIPTTQPTQEMVDDAVPMVNPKRLEWLIYGAFKNQADLVVAMAKDWQRLTDAWSKDLSSVFNTFGTQVSSAWLSAVVALTAGNAPDFRDRKMVTKADPVAFPEWDDAAEEILETVRLMDLTVPYEMQYRRVLHSTAGLLNEILELGVGLQDTQEIAVVAQGGKRVGLVDMAGQTRDAMFDALAAAREAGDGPPQAARKIRDYVSAGPWRSADVRSVVIARTETKYAQNVSSIAVGRAADTVTAMQVVDAQLGPTDEDCELLDGQIVTFAEAESLALEEHPNGTRSFTPFVGQPAGVEGEQAAAE